MVFSLVLMTTLIAAVAAYSDSDRQTLLRDHRKFSPNVQYSQDLENIARAYLEAHPEFTSHGNFQHNRAFNGYNAENWAGSGSSQSVHKWTMEMSQKHADGFTWPCDSKNDPTCKCSEMKNACNIDGCSASTGETGHYTDVAQSVKMGCFSTPQQGTVCDYIIDGARDPCEKISAAVASLTTTPSASSIPSSTASPTAAASNTPSAQPSASASFSPSSMASTTPSAQPSTSASISTTAVPSATSSKVPSATPSAVPSTTPSVVISTTPSAESSTTPSAEASTTPSAEASTTPSAEASTIPSAEASTTPSAEASTTPSAVPSTTPSVVISTTPSAESSTTPSAEASTIPSAGTSTTPLAIPSTTPSTVPSATPSALPSTTPAAVASTTPSPKSSTTPSTVPSATPSTMPSATPSTVPSATPSAVPSTTPSAKSSTTPSTVPSATPSAVLSTTPSAKSSTTPSTVPSAKPSNQPNSKLSANPSPVANITLSVLPSTDSSVSPVSKASTAPSAQQIPSSISTAPAPVALSNSGEQNNATPSAKPAMPAADRHNIQCNDGTRCCRYSGKCTQDWSQDKCTTGCDSNSSDTRIVHAENVTQKDLSRHNMHCDDGERCCRFNNKCTANWSQKKCTTKCQQNTGDDNSSENTKSMSKDTSAAKSKFKIKDNKRYNQYCEDGSRCCRFSNKCTSDWIQDKCSKHC